MSWEPQISLGIWGRLQIVIGGKDITFFRNVPTEVQSWSSGDPFDDASAILVFPQISPYEPFGTGSLSWLEGHAAVDLFLIRPSGPKHTLWEGMIASIEEDTTDTKTAITVQCIGALYQLDYYVRAPKNLSEGNERLYEKAIADEFHPPSGRVQLHTTKCKIVYPTDPEPMENTGWLTRYSGSWEYVLTGYIQRLLADMVHNPDMILEPAEEETPGQNEVQEIVLDPDQPPFPWGSDYPSATLDGNWWLVFRGQQTPAIRWDGDRHDVRDALQSLSNCDGVNVTGNGTSGSPWVVTFTGPNVRERSHPLMKIIHSDLRHNHPTTRVTRVTEGQAGQPGKDEVTSGPWEGQWTLLKENGRRPVLMLRDEETVSWTVTAGAPGVVHRLKSDFGQANNVIFGEGTDESGTMWRNSEITVNGQGQASTVHHPVGWDEQVHPARIGVSVSGEPTTPPPGVYSEDNIRVEAIQKYGAGVSLLDAMRSAQQQIKRESDPGWFGSITLSTDPQEGSRFEIKAGTNLLLRHFRDHVPKDEGDPDPPNDEKGIVLHVAQAEINFSAGTVELTVDSKYRDLATLASIIERNKRENNNPAKMLMANRQSGNTDDTKFPWDYTAGSGSIPRESNAARVAMLPTGTPNSTPERFVFVNGANSDSFKRWTIIPVIAAGKGSVSRCEIRAFNSSGNPLAIPFHVGVYQLYITEFSMPQQPFADGVWNRDSDDPLAGFDPSAAVLWGQGGQRAGYWPGLESEGNPPTGILIDEGTWQFQLPEGENILWVAFYAETNAWFQGRFFHGVQ